MQAGRQAGGVELGERMAVPNHLGTLERQTLSSPEVGGKLLEACPAPNSGTFPQLHEGQGRHKATWQLFCATVFTYIEGLDGTSVLLFFIFIFYFETGSPYVT